MKPEKYSSFKVGAFVFGGIILFCLVIILLGANQFLFKPQFQLKISVNQSQGLDIGSIVTFAGINVGHVSRVDYVTESTTVELTLDIDMAFQNAITNLSVAKIKTQGALGDKYVFITPGDSGGTVLKSGEFIRTEKNEDFLDLLTSKSTELENIGVLVQEMSTLFKNMNANDRSAILMENLAAVTKNLKSVTADPALSASVKRLDSILTKIDKGQGTLGRLINEPTLHERLLDLLGESKRNRYLKPLLQESAKSSVAP